MYMSFERSSVQKMPVLIMSQRLAARPGTMAANSIRTYSGVRPSALAISLPSSQRMPCSSPRSLTNCSGGSVGFMDITSVFALMMLGGATLACARAARGNAPVSASAPAPAITPRRVAEPNVSVMGSLPRPAGDGAGTHPDCMHSVCQPILSSSGMRSGA